VRDLLYLQVFANRQKVSAPFGSRISL